MFNKLLIANRGEIACRIIKSAKRLGIECIAVYSTADADSLHTALADQAYWIGESEARSSYLNVEAIISVAKQSGAEAIHPGYGFLSENPIFARACQDANILFVGPSIAAMEAMASKQLAKQLLAKTSVPLTPGYHGDDQSEARLLQEATQIGFPVLLKAANGGGGKGMRKVTVASDFQTALLAAKREAFACFGDEVMIIEKYITEPRHIEIQLMADNFGNVVHLFERDCSIQRRHQKVIEEAPAPGLAPTTRQQIADAAIQVAKVIDYRGAGTVEFLVDQSGQCYFMEMNTRLQVEHPVTEMITGLDLVEWQLRIAANEPLPCNQQSIQAKGHAIECRIYAEDPNQQFIPSIGRVRYLKEPDDLGIRIDTGVKLDTEITRYYDPMIAKLIAFGETRHEAIQRLTKALDHYWIGGIKTNIPLLKAIALHPKFKDGDLSTHFLSQYSLTYASPSADWALIMAASYDYLHMLPHFNTALQLDTFAWQMHLSTQWVSQYLLNGEKHRLIITPLSYDNLTITFNGTSITLKLKYQDSQLWLDDGKQIRRCGVYNEGEMITFFSAEGTVQVERFNWKRTEHEVVSNHQLTAPMPATIVAVLKKTGDVIKAGDPIIVLEAMKMEHTIQSPRDGILGEIFYVVGQQVNEGVELVELRSTQEEH
jgi:3-methylcrotonyl-CoA carboxylase alpha subunit